MYLARQTLGLRAVYVCEYYSPFHRQRRCVHLFFPDEVREGKMEFQGLKPITLTAGRMVVGCTMGR